MALQLNTDMESKPPTAHVDHDLEDLVPGFLENRRNDIQEIKKALTIRDFERIRILGHSMKGSGGGYGFNDISSIGLTIEDAAKSEDTDLISKGVARLTDYLNEVRIIYI